MIYEFFATMRAQRQAQRRHQPPAELLEHNGKYVSTRLLLANDTTGLLKRVYDQAPTTSNAYAVANVAGLALLHAGVSLMAMDNGLRTYLIDKEKIASELPPRPVKSVEYERNFGVTVLLEPGAWSLLKVMENTMELSPDVALRYGMTIMRTLQQNPDLKHVFVDSVGKFVELNTTFPPDLDLSDPSLD